MTVLVQTTGFVEKGTVKCERYFPENVGETLNVGVNWAVTMKTLDLRAGYNFSNLNILNRRTGASRDAAHFWFNTWPDHGVPTKEGA